jgi:Sec-independent protein secretion pathway component TatC
MVALAAFLVAFGLTTWQSDLVLEIVNAPLPGDMEPITLGPAEPFIATLKNAAYAALLLGLPVSCTRRTPSSSPRSTPARASSPSPSY